jgi:aromatic-L-amino-acid decarboxylase
MRVRGILTSTISRINTEAVVNYYDTLPDRRVVSNVEPGYLKKLLPSGPPQKGEAWTEIQKDIETKIMPGLTHWYAP